uniref:Uncharacterized protein n=1 Tax=Cucumis melo TaxID=3656 RepID=A0A9I9E7U2_CUCME
MSARRLQMVFRASHYKKSDLWMLRKYIFDHDCSLTTTLSSHMFMSTDRSIPKEIVHKTHTNLGVNISYQKALRAKEHIVKILKGNKIESYTLIPCFFDKLIKSNPSTYTALEMDDNGHFKFFFMTFGASIEGWKYCRPIISIGMGHF